MYKDNNLEIEALMPPPMIMHEVIAVVAGLLLPAILIPIVSVTGFSEIVEEIAKALIVTVVILPLPRFGQSVFWAGMFGLSFGISETAFYASGIVETGNYSILADRFFLTIPMHILTVLIVTVCGKMGKKYLFLGLILAIILHLSFNYFVTLWF